MNGFLEWLRDPTVQFIGWTFGAIGWVVGFVSGLVQVKSYLQQRRLEGAYQNILEQARRDWEGRYSEEQIQELARQAALLQSRIADDVPNEARRVFLEEQRHSLAQTIGQSYGRYTDLSRQLAEPATAAELPAEIKRSIEAAIMPAYLGERRRQRVAYWLTAAAFAASLVPWFVQLLWQPLYVTVRVGRWQYPILVLFVFVATVITCSYLIRRSWGITLDDWAQRRPIPFWILSIISWAISVPTLLLFFLLSSDWRPGWGPDWYFGIGTTLFVAALTTVGIVLAVSLSMRMIIGARSG
jgi:hypothetical protein